MRTKSPLAMRPIRQNNDLAQQGPVEQTKSSTGPFFVFKQANASRLRPKKIFRLPRGPFNPLSAAVRPRVARFGHSWGNCPPSQKQTNTEKNKHNISAR